MTIIDFAKDILQMAEDLNKARIQVLTLEHQIESYEKRTEEAMKDSTLCDYKMSFGLGHECDETCPSVHPDTHGCVLPKGHSESAHFCSGLYFRPGDELKLLRERVKRLEAELAYERLP